MSAILAITLLIVSASVSLVALAESDITETLRMAQVLFRHGARAPIGTYPSDPHKLYPWVGGFGELTTVGAEQAFALGRNLRRYRYGSLVPSNGLYSTRDMYVVSSTNDRCIMTAQSVLAGFLEPPEGAVDIPILWQPATVNVLSEAEDSILAQTKACPKYDEASAQSLVNPPQELAKWLQSLPAQYEFASQHAGMPINSIYDLIVLYDAIETETYFGLPQPAWTNEVYPNKTAAFYKGLLLKFTATPQMERLRGGFILTEIVRNMRAKHDGTLSPNRSLFFYSGQDLTHVSLLKSMGMIDQTTFEPAFASAVAFELHENVAVAPDSEVKIVYYEDSNVQEPRHLIIPDCEEPCPLEKFELAMQHIYVEDFDEACKSENAALTHRAQDLLVFLFIVVASFRFVAKKYS